MITDFIVLILCIMIVEIFITGIKVNFKGTKENSGDD